MRPIFACLLISAGVLGAGTGAAAADAAARYQEARERWRDDRFEEAIPPLAEIIERHRDHPVAEHAVELLLDSYARLRRHEELLVLVESLLRDDAFLAGKPDLERRLESLRGVGARMAAEALEAARDYEGCGRAYMEIYNRDPSGPRTDEILYNAAVCFELAGSAAVAIAALDALLRGFPRSSLARLALMRQASLYARITDFGRAANRLEDYVRRYPRERDADVALSQAVRYRIALGQDREALAAIELFVKLFGKSMPEAAADAQLLAADLYEQQGAAEKAVRQLERLLRHARGRERAIVIHARIGALLWQQSCRRPAADGSCSRLERRTAPARCDGAPAAITRPLRRDRRLATSAREHLERAVDLAGRVADPGQAAARWQAAARFYLAEEHYERLLAPGARPEIAEEALRAYERVGRGGGGPTWPIAAAARTAQIHLHVAEAEALTGACERAAALAETAADAFANCAEAARRAGALTDRARLCQRELTRLRPADHPPSRELHPAANEVGSLTTTHDLLALP